MPSGNVVASDKMQFTSGGGGGGGGEMPYHPHFGQWHPDERDEFISWLRGEFAAANAIIDSLSHHLRLVGEPGEYDWVIGCIQQRRCNWSPVIQMQQYFPVSDVIYALQQVAWRRQRRCFDPVKAPAKDFKRSGFGSRQGQKVELVKGSNNSNIESHSYDANVSCNLVGLEKGERLTGKEGEAKLGREELFSDSALSDSRRDVVSKTQEESFMKISDNSLGAKSCNSEPEVERQDDEFTSDSAKGPRNVSVENDAHSIQHPRWKQNPAIIPKTFVGMEKLVGKEVNVVDGMKLYEDLLDVTEVSKLVSFVNDRRAAGKSGQFQGNLEFSGIAEMVQDGKLASNGFGSLWLSADLQSGRESKSVGHTFVFSKRPMKGHGSEMIQLGVPNADAPPEGESYSDQRMESMPGLLQDVIECLVGMQVMTVKPDTCIIDIFNEGDHSQPHMWPSCLGRPVYLLFLTECEMKFGKEIGIDHPGDYRGSLKLSLAAGSLLAMEGKSADFAKHAIPSLRKQCILVTFSKSQPKKTTLSNGRIPSPAGAPTSHWGRLSSRSQNHIHNPVPKHYGPMVLGAPSVRPHMAPQNGIQPLFVPAPIAQPMAFPGPVAVPPASAGWAAPPPRHPLPRLPVSGTGVFLPPPGSGHPSTQQSSSATTTDTNFSPDAPPVAEKENGLGKQNGYSSASPKGKVDRRMPRQECNGFMDGNGGGSVATKEEEQQNAENEGC
ncbi:hypothetical protein U1Q18_029773 [Sarracenia purpurea var. burkii]